MKKDKKEKSNIDFTKVKATASKIGKKLLLILKEIWKIIVIFFKKLPKIRVGKFNGVHIFVGVVLVLLLFLVMISGNKNEVAYPVVFNNVDGDLYLIDTKIKNEEDAIKLGNGESAGNVIYANTTDRYVLFQKNESLYLYDAKEKEETTKIVDDIAKYQFTEDDKYVVALNKDDELIVYNYKESEKIEKDVASIIYVTEDKILYNKENILYVRSVNPKKDDRLKVTEDYNSNISFSEDGKNIIYTDSDRKLHIFNIKKDEDEVIAKDVSSYYCDDKSCEKMFFVESADTKTVYYYDGKDRESMVKDIYSINAYDVAKKQLVFTKIDEKEYALYYQKLGNDPVLIEDGLDSLRTVKLFKGKDIYYINADNEVKYVGIKGAKLSHLKTIGEDVNGYLHLYKDGYAFIGDMKNNSGTLYLAKNGKAKEIDENVNGSLITVGNNGKSIYYLKDYKTTGDLYVTKGGKGKEIEKDIYNFKYVKDDLIYLIKDYSISKSRGDLYRYTNKSVLIAEDIVRVASVPVHFELD